MNNDARLRLSSSDPVIADNVIAGNWAASRGGGLYLDNADPLITNNTITANTADSHGGGAYTLYSHPTIANTVVAFNSSGLFASSGGPTTRHNCVFGNGAYNFSGLSDPTGTNGNLSTDPLFARLPNDGGDGWGDNPSTPGVDEAANDDYGDLHLQAGSPCIDAGDNDDTFGDGDLDGHPRIAWCTVDMGAYEYQGPFGDFFNDCDVDLEDYALLEVCLWFSGPGVIPPFDECIDVFDFDPDNDVDLGDVAKFQQVFTIQ